MSRTLPHPKSLTNRVVVAVLRSPIHIVLSKALMELRFTGRRSERLFSMPVQYARLGPDLVLYPGKPDQKVWWRNFEEPASVCVVLAGGEEERTATVVRPGDTQYADARDVYASRFKMVKLPAEAPLVLLRRA